MFNKNRRGVVLAAGGALAAGAMGDMAWAAPPDRKLGYAIVGLGSYGLGVIIPQFKNCKNSRLVALVSGDAAKAKRVAQEYGVPDKNIYNYDNYDAIRDNPDIDIVYVCLPVSMHAEYTIRAAKAGKHVLCEKPMAVSSAECEAMIAACRRADRKLMIGYRCHFEQYNLYAIDQIRQGTVGKPRVITAEHGFYAQPNQWRLDRPLSGGGSLMDIGIYSLNAVRYLTGEEPVEVSAIEATDRNDPRFRTVEDRISFLLRFPSGIETTCVSSYSSNHNMYRVTGTEGWIELEPATSYEGQKMWIRRDGRTEERQVPAGKGQHAGQLDHLAECILNDTKPLVAGEEGLADMKVIEAIYRSAREGRRIAIA